MNLLGSLLIAFSMYSRIPMPQVAWTKERMKYAMCFFPLIGAGIGLLVYLICFFAESYGFPYIRKMIPMVVPVLVTGGIHMDGLLDVIDARASHGEKTKKLEILKDPHTGAFAIIGCAVYFLVYLVFFMELDSHMIPAYCIGFVITRALSGLSVVTFPMAKSSGLAAAFSSGAQKRTVGVTMVIYLAAAFFGIWSIEGGKALLTMVSISSLIYGWYYHMAKQEFGGITGDLAGYFLQICELALLIGISILSHF